MGASSCGRAKYVLLFAALLLAAFSSTRDVNLHAQELEPAQRWDGLIELISGRYPYAPPVAEPPTPADGPSQMSRHAISGDGRYIVFTAEAPNLGSSTLALYRRDRRTSETNMLISGQIREAVTSTDGNHIALTICDPWMRPDFLEICDVWSIDTRTWTWSLMSGTLDGTHGDANSSEPVLSANGRFVVFRTAAANLIGGGPASVTQLVVRDRDNDRNGILDEPGTMILEAVSVGSGLVPGDGPSETAEVSDDGRYVAFRSLAGNLVANDTNGVWDVFRRDRHLNETRRLNLRPQDLESPVSIDSPAVSMSADGEWIAFTSADGLLAPGALDDTNNVRDVFIFDAWGAGTLTRVDIGINDAWPGMGGHVPGNGPASWPSLSADGRYVAFESAATNVALPPTPGTTQVYVFDLRTGTPTRVSLKPDGSQPDADTVRPMISADGSLVAFTSQALNLSANVTTPFDRVYAAVHFSISPHEVIIPGAGGIGTYTITTQQHTQWWVDWNNWPFWIGFESAPQSVGSGELQFSAAGPNPDATRRSATIRIFDQSMVFTQLAGLSITSISPTSGPQAGGTPVTVRGTGFEPGMDVRFDGVFATSTQFVDDTTLIATTPEHNPGTVWVGILMPDGRNAWIDQAFRYIDGTPPMLWHGLQGDERPDGWYGSDVTITWAWWDPESEVTSTNGCDQTILNTDTDGTTFTCTATSEGGTATASVTVKRDTQGPTVTITTPQSTIYGLHSAVVPEVSCTDALSGVEGCGADGGGSLDTHSSGWHTFSAHGFDRALNGTPASVEYAVSNGVCTPVTPGLRLWFEFENNGLDSIHGSTTGGQQPPFVLPTYVPGMVGKAFALPGWQFFSFAHQLDDPKLNVQFTGAMTFAAWVKADGHDGEAGMIASKEDQFRIARFPDGTIRWAFANAETGFAWVNTGVTMPQGAWTHLAVTYDHGVVKTYVNGRLAHTHIGSTDMEPVAGLPHWGGWLSFGNRYDPAHQSFLQGAIDEVQLLDVVWDQPAVEASFFAGPDGMCRLTRTVIFVSVPPTTYGGTTFPTRAQLRTAFTQQPLAGKPLRLVSRASLDNSIVETTTLITDANGWVEWNAPLGPGLGASQYAFAFEAFFDADLEFGGSRGIGTLNIEAATPVITWPTPAPIVYGTPVSEIHHNATADVPGTFRYGAPNLGTVLPAGQHLLTVTFDPDNWNYRDTTASVTLEVLEGEPVLTWNPPASIGYGTALGPSQLNATATVAGTWSYAPGAGTVLNAGSGQTLTATFTPTNTSYNTASISRSIDVLKATPAITLTGGAFTYDGQPHAATASVTGAGGAVLGPIELTYNGSPDAPSTSGTYDVVASFAGDANYTSASATATLTIAKATPTLTWNGPAGIVYGTTLGAAQLNASSNAPGVFEYAPAAGTLLNAGNGQTLTATFVPADAANYHGGTVSTTIDVAKAAPAMSVTGGAFTYDATAHPAAGSATGIHGEDLGPLAFTYNGSTDVPVNAGSYAVVGSYAGSANYNAASASATIVIAKANATLTWTQPARIVYGTALDGSQLNAAATVPGAFLYKPDIGTVLNAGAGQTLTALFSPTDATNYESGWIQTTIDVAKRVPAVAVTGGSFTYDGAAHPAAGSVLGLGGEPLGPLAFTYNDSPNAPVNAGSYAVVGTYAGSVNYESGSGTATIVIGKASAILSWSQPAAVVYGTPLGAAQLNATSNTGGVFEYAPAAGTVLNAGQGHALSATFTPADTANYNGGTVNTTIDVTKATATLTWAQPAGILYGTPLDASQLNATSNIAGELTYAPASGTVLNAGNGQILTATFVPADASNYENGSISTTIDVAKRTPAVTVSGGSFTYDGAAHPATGSVVGLGGEPLGPLAITYNDSPDAPVNAGSYAVVGTYAGSVNYESASGTAAIIIAKAPVTLSWSQPAAVVYGTALSAAQLNASSNAAGSFAYSPAAGTVLNAGDGHALSATFIPADATNYTSGVVATTIDVSRAPLAVRANDASKRFGAPLPVFTGSAAGFVNGDSFTSLAGALVFSTTATQLSPVGAYPIVPSGVSSPNYTITFVHGALTVIRGSVAVTLATSPEPSGFDQPMTFTATVGAATPAAGQPTGVVQFFDGATLLGSAPLNAGSASMTTAGLDAGSRTIEARYEGDGSFENGAQTAPHLIYDASGTPVISITSSKNPSNVGQSVTLTANVSLGFGSVNGVVEFYSGATLLGSSSIASGHATLITDSLPAASHVITARYLGAGDVPPLRSGAFVQAVGEPGWKDRPTTITLTSEDNPSVLGAGLAFIAEVTGSWASAPTGRILFMVNGEVVGDSAVTPLAGTTSRAAIFLSGLNHGRHKVTATYQGDPHYKGSTATVTQTVN